MYIETLYISSHMGPIYVETPYISSHIGPVYSVAPYNTWVLCILSHPI